MTAASHVLMIAAAAMVALTALFAGVRTVQHEWRADDLEGFCGGLLLCALGLLMAGGALALIGEFNA